MPRSKKAFGVFLVLIVIVDLTTRHIRHMACISNAMKHSQTENVIEQRYKDLFQQTVVF